MPKRRGFFPRVKIYNIVVLLVKICYLLLGYFDTVDDIDPFILEFEYGSKKVSLRF